MSDLIDRNELLERFYCEKDVSSTLWGIDGIENLLLNAPTVQAKPVVHGEWEKTRLAGEYICSNCQSLICSGFTRMGYEQCKFCPECGADMRKKVE